MAWPSGGPGRNSVPLSSVFVASSGCQSRAEQTLSLGLDVTWSLWQRGRWSRSLGDSVVLFLLTSPAQTGSAEAAAGAPWSVQGAGSLADRMLTGPTAPSRIVFWGVSFSGCFLEGVEEEGDFCPHLVPPHPCGFTWASWDPGLSHLLVVSWSPNTEQEVWTLAPFSKSLAVPGGHPAWAGKKQISLLCGPSWEVKTACGAKSGPALGLWSPRCPRTFA